MSSPIISEWYMSGNTFLGYSVIMDRWRFQELVNRAIYLSRDYTLFEKVCVSDYKIYSISHVICLDIFANALQIKEALDMLDSNTRAYIVVEHEISPDTRIHHLITISTPEFGIVEMTREPLMHALSYLWPFDRQGRADRRMMWYIPGRGWITVTNVHEYRTLLNSLGYHVEFTLVPPYPVIRLKSATRQISSEEFGQIR